VTFTPVPSACPGLPRIGGAPDVPTFGNLRDAKIVDIDEDGVLDILGSDDGSILTLLRGVGDGTFRDPPIMATFVFGGVDVADVDGDGHLDVAYSTWETFSSKPVITFLRGHGDGAFDAPVELDISRLGSSIAFGDFDGDGRRDIAAGVFADGVLAIDVLFGRGDGTFAPFVTVATFPRVKNHTLILVTGDVDGDGRTDIATWEYVDTTLRTFYGNADRSFVTGQPLTAGLGFYGTAADVDADGRADLLFDSGGGVTIVRGRADRMLEALMISGEVAAGIAAADLDGDGLIDVIRGSEYLRGSGPGTFGSGVKYSDGLQGAHAADLDGDGTVDVVSGSHILLNNHGTFRWGTPYDHRPRSMHAAADFDNDGAIDILQGNDQGTVVRRGYGDGTFGDGLVIDGLMVFDLQLADVNRDGNVDLVTRGGIPIGNEDVGLSVHVRLGRGDGTFEAPYVAGSLPRDVDWQVVDVDRDGSLDLAWGTIVFRGIGDGTFEAPIDSDTGFLKKFVGNYADVNGDGILDLIALGEVSAICLGVGDGTFQSPIALDVVGFVLNRFLVDDINADGAADLIFQQGGGLVVALGHGDGTFTPTYPGWRLLPHSIADVNRDGFLDIVSIEGLIALGDGAGGFARPLSYLQVSLERAVPADVDGDGRIDLLSATHFARHNGCPD
jgi:hypothetical protein